MKLVGSHGQNTTLDTVQEIDVPDQATHVLLSARTQAVSVTFDGTAPTASKGLHIPTGAAPEPIPVESGTTIKAIEEAASATLDYQFAQGAD